MRKLCSLIVLSTFLLSFTVPGFAAGPCKPIADVCEKYGYYRGGSDKGKGLIKDCIIPVSAKKKKLPNTNFDNATLSACKAFIEEEMKSRNM